MLTISNQGTDTALKVVIDILLFSFYGIVNVAPQLKSFILTLV